MFELFFKPQPKCFEEKMDLIIESCYCDWMRKVAEGKDEDKKFKRKEILTKIQILVRELEENS